CTCEEGPVETKKLPANGIVAALRPTMNKKDTQEPLEGGLPGATGDGLSTPYKCVSNLNSVFLTRQVIAFGSHNLSFSTSLQIITIIPHGTLIGAGHLVVGERALGVALRGGDGLLVIHLARALDAHALERDARHVAAG